MSYPPNQGYPGQYPPQGGYPPQGFPPQQGGYPPPQGYPPQGGFPPQGYPPQQGGYPPPQQGGFPPQGYPPQQGGYPPPQTGYPPQQQYPPQGYPPQGYPPQQQYPPQGYPPQQQPGYPPQGGYAPQPGYPPQGGYPPQQGGYVPQQGVPVWYISQPPPQLETYAQAEADAEALYKAMKGLGTNDSVLSSIVATRTRPQLQEIKAAYARKHTHTLEKDIKGDTSGHYEDFLLSLIAQKDEYDAQLIHQAVAGLGTNDEELIEVICTRNNMEIQAMKAAYMKLHSREMEKDVAGDVSGDYKKLLLQILKADRPENQPPNPEAAKVDAQRLWKAGEGRFGTDEAVFIEILTQRSFPQLHLIAQIYGQIAGHSLDLGIAKETSYNFKKALLVLVTPREEYFAAEIHKAIQGWGTHDRMLIRNLSYLSNSTPLFRAANDWYMHNYKHNIENDVNADVSGWYGKTAKALIHHRVNY